MQSGFVVKQQEFSDYLRDPWNNPAPVDVKPERMAIYRELFFNNIESFLSQNFPVIRQILTEEAWSAMASDFYGRHICKTPYFSEIAEEFLDYLQNERNQPSDPPFLMELAHYEWAEMALSIAEADTSEHPMFIGDWNAAGLNLSSLAWPLVYRYPVHRLGPDFQPAIPPEQSTFIVIYRDADDEVRFLEITPLTFGLLQAIENQPGCPLSTYLQTLTGSVAKSQAPALFENGLKIVRDLTNRQIIIATHPA